MLELNRWYCRTQFGADVRVRLYRKIAKMLANGLPLLKILDELWARASQHGRKPGEPLAVVLADCRRMVQNGRALSDGLAWWVPSTEAMIIAAGEQSGRMESTLDALVGVVQAQRKIKQVILGGMAYPLAVLSMIVIYLYVFGTRVIPQFAAIVDPASWHGAARSMYLMSQLVQHWLALIVLVLVAALAILFGSLPYWRGNARVLADRYAPFSVYRLIAGSGFLMAFAALQHAGITVEKSLARLSEHAQPWLRERLDGALLGVKSGLNCGEALRVAGYGFPSPDVVDDLCVYAEYKGFAEALRILADEWMEDGVVSVTRQMHVLNGASILALAAVIGWLVSGFFGIQNEIAMMARAVR